MNRIVSRHGGRRPRPTSVHSALKTIVLLTTTLALTTLPGSLLAAALPQEASNHGSPGPAEDSTGAGRVQGPSSGSETASSAAAAQDRALTRCPEEESQDLGDAAAAQRGERPGEGTDPTEHNGVCETRHADSNRPNEKNGPNSDDARDNPKGKPPEKNGDDRNGGHKGDDEDPDGKDGDGKADADGKDDDGNGEDDGRVGRSRDDDEEEPDEGPTPPGQAGVGATPSPLPGIGPAGGPIAPAPLPQPGAQVAGIMVTKTNDADGDGAFSSDEEASSEGATVEFRVAVTNVAQGPVRITGVTDSFGTVTIRICPGLVGERLNPGASLTCSFALDGYSPPLGSALANSVEVTAVETGGEGRRLSATAISTVTSVGVLGAEIARGGAAGTAGGLAATGLGALQLAALAAVLIVAGAHASVLGRAPAAMTGLGWARGATMPRWLSAGAAPHARTGRPRFGRARASQATSASRARSRRGG